jgi:hypothetical protein
MTYVSWAALYEGPTDQSYFDLLLPRVMEDLILQRGTRNVTIPAVPAVRISRGSVEQVAAEACRARDAFHLVFIHADTGGRGLSAGLEYRSGAYCQAMHDLCEWPPDRCIRISPSHETEAWVLADPGAVTDALGYRGAAAEIGLPEDATQAERLVDPKAALENVMARVRGRRRSLDVQYIFPAIAQRQRLELLRRSRSFASFEAEVAQALVSLGCIM